MGCLRKRDAAALLAALLLVALSLSDRGRPRLEHAWTHTLAPAARKYDNGAYPRPHERLPPPLITDLDGDGRREVVLVTREPSLLILAVADDADGSDGIDVAAGAGAGRRRAGKVLAQVSLLGLTRSPRGRQPVSLASGFLDPFVVSAAAAPASSGSRLFSSASSSSSSPRKQSIVVVLESWAVLCFDHGLRLRWETAANHIESSLGIGALVHREVAAMVSSLSMRNGDTGVVVVGGSMTLRDGVDDGHFEIGGMRLQEDTDASDSPDFQAEAELQAKRDIYYAKVARAEHFSYYAFDGATGQLRWKQERGPASSEEDPDADEDDENDNRVRNSRHRGHGHGHGHHHHDRVTTPRGYKTTPDALRHLGRGGSAEPGEYHWRSFRSSILKQLPHSWTGRDDTRIGLAHFRRDSEGRRAAHWTGGGRGGSGGGGSNRRASLLVHPSATSALHGEVPLSVMASNANEQIVDPNVIVAHTSRGMEILHAFTGRIVARIGLPEPRYGGGAGAYADLNGDRIIDHVQAIPGLESEPGGAEGMGHHHYEHHDGGDGGGDSGGGGGGGGGHKHGGGGRSLGQNHGRSAHFQLPSCWVQTVSGVPPVEQLWNGSLCDPYSYYRASTRNAYAAVDAASAGLARTLLEAGGGAEVGAGQSEKSAPPLSDAERDSTRVSAPALVRHAASQQPQQSGARAARRAVVPYDVVVLVSTGVVSCYGPRGQLHWQTPPTAATWHRPNEQFQVVGTSRDVDAFMPSTVVADVEIQEGAAAVATGAWFRWWWGGHNHYQNQYPYQHRRVVMATGDSAAELIDLADGTLLSSLPLADPVTAKPVVGDFDNDGHNDFVLVTRHAVLGVRIGRSAPSWFALLGLAVFLILVAFVASLHCAGLIDFSDADEQDDEDDYSDRSGGVRRFEVERFLWKRQRKSKRAMD